MDAPQAARPSSHPSLLQFFRSLLGYPRSSLEPRTEQQEQGAAVGPRSWQAERVETTHGGIQEHCEDEEGDSMELLLGELREVSLQGSLGSSTSRSCLTTSTSDVEVAVEGDGMEATGGTVALQSDGTAGEERGATDEAVVGRALVMDEFLQGLGAADEDTCSASPEPMFSMDLDTEWEKGHLLKAKQGAGSPKAELSLWNRFISVNRHQWTLRKARASRSSMELESEEQPLLRADESSTTSPELPVLPADPVYRWAPPPAMGASPPPGPRRSVPSESAGPQSRAEGSPRSTRWHSRTSNRAGPTQPNAADARGSVRGSAGSPRPAGGQRGWKDGNSNPQRQRDMEPRCSCSTQPMC